MSIAVRYYTESHNTEKLCKAAADAIGVEALTVDTPLDGPSVPAPTSSPSRSRSRASSRLTRTRLVRSTSSAARLSGSPA